MRAGPYLLIGAPDWVTLSAFAEGLDRIGRRCVWGSHGAVDLNATNPAAIVIDGMRAGGLQTVRQAAERGIPCVVIDNGFLRRVNTPKDHDTGHFYIGFGGLGWAPPVAPDHARFRALDITPTIRAARPDGPVLILGQVPGDASHGLSAPALAAVYARMVRELRAAGVDRIRFRPHPLGWSMAPDGCEQREPGAESLDAAIADARFVIALNSNAGLDAILAGVPAVTVLPSHYGPLAYRWPVIPSVIDPPHPDAIEAHCARLAWAQWTLAEMRAAEPQRWLIKEGLAP